MSYSRWISSRFYTYWHATHDKLMIDDNETGCKTLLTYEEAKELREYLEAFIYDWEIERDG